MMNGSEMFEIGYLKTVFLRGGIGNFQRKTDDITGARKLFTSYGVIEKANAAIAEQTAIANESLKNITDANMREGLQQFGEYLLGRAY